MDWPDTLNFALASTNLHVEMLRDWYRDPWSWPEIAWAVDKRPDLIVERLNTTGVLRISKLDVPKDNFGTRPAVVLDPLDRLAYQALVDVASRSLIGGLRWWVYGWRLPRKDPAAGRYSPNETEWKLYRNWLSRLASLYPFGLTTDIVSFFANIPTELIAEDVRSTAGGQVGARLADMLEAWARTSGRSGIPQRSIASSALANRYLQPLDDTLEAVSRNAVPGSRYPTAIRWMDDIWVFGSDESQLRRGQVAIDATIRDLHLNMGTGKTKLLAGEALIEASKAVEHSAVDAGLAEEPPDAEPLDSLVARLTASPETASRTSVAFAATRIRASKRWEHVDSFVGATAKMPHAADHVGRILRDAGSWRGLQEWFVAYCRSPWGCFDWSIAQLGAMFPSDGDALETVSNYFASVIPQHRTLPLAAIAAQRLASWRPDEARPLLREAVKASSEPLERRVLALSLLAAGETRAFVRSALSEFLENRVTLLMLEDRRFRPLPLAADYAG